MMSDIVAIDNYVSNCAHGNLTPLFSSNSKRSTYKPGPASLSSNSKHNNNVDSILTESANSISAIAVSAAGLASLIEGPSLNDNKVCKKSVDYAMIENDSLESLLNVFFYSNLTQKSPTRNDEQLNHPQSSSGKETEVSKSIDRRQAMLLGECAIVYECRVSSI